MLSLIWQFGDKCKGFVDGLFVYSVICLVGE